MTTGPFGTTTKKTDAQLAEELDRLKERTEQIENRQEEAAERIEQEAKTENRAELFALSFKDGADAGRADRERKSNIKNEEKKQKDREKERAREQEQRKESEAAKENEDDKEAA